jgi:hypothetical protein
MKTPKKYHKNIHKSLTNFKKIPQNIHKSLTNFKTIPQNHSRNNNQPNLN